MNHLKSIWPAMKVLLLAALGWATAHAAAVAKDAEPAEADKGGTWVLSYALVLLGIGLGMLIMLRSSRRRERAKPEQYAEGKGRYDDET